MLLTFQTVVKPWGVVNLPSPFGSAGMEQIGEIWFDPPPALPDILIKYIFTADKLSVQVHPSDADTEAAGLGRRGKEECWLITSAEPGASLAIGFKDKMNAEAVRAAALDGSIEDLLVWHPVSAGDFFYIPAGTVHAIGAGVSLIEVQQTSDITYRLYDYGRPRDLHLDEAMAVAKLEPYDQTLRNCIAQNYSRLLVEGPHFRLAYVDGSAPGSFAHNPAGPCLVIPIQGSVNVDGELVRSGECSLLEHGALQFGEQARFLIASSASQ